MSNEENKTNSGETTRVDRVDFAAMFDDNDPLDDVALDSFIIECIEDISEEHAQVKANFLKALADITYRNRARKAAEVVILYASMAMALKDEIDFKEVIEVVPKERITPDVLVLTKWIALHVRDMTQSDVRDYMTSVMKFNLYENRIDLLIGRMDKWAMANL